MGKKKVPNPLSRQLKRVGGAMRSGSPAAYFSMLITALGMVTRPADRLFVNKAVDRTVWKKKLPPVLMIVSAPRSGSTIAYQLLAKSIPCVYISNLHALFPFSASTYMHRHRKFGSFSPVMRNYYGHTSSLFDVNEGNIFFESFTKKTDVRIIRENFIRFIQTMGASPRYPLVCKNVGVYDAIDRLHRAVPEITFLRINRKKEQVIRSVLKAYHEIGYFNPVPEHLSRNRVSDPVEFAVDMITSLDCIIENKKKKIQPSAWYEWSYGELCRDPWPMIEKISSDCFGFHKSRLQKNDIPALKESSSVNVTPEEATKIAAFLSRYNT